MEEQEKNQRKWVKERNVYQCTAQLRRDVNTEPCWTDQLRPSGIQPIWWRPMNHLEHHMYVGEHAGLFIRKMRDVAFLFIQPFWKYSVSKVLMYVLYSVCLVCRSAVKQNIVKCKVTSVLTKGAAVIFEAYSLNFTEKWPSLLCTVSVIVCLFC